MINKHLTHTKNVGFIPDLKLYPRTCLIMYIQERWEWGEVRDRTERDGHIESGETDQRDSERGERMAGVHLTF